MAGRSGDAIATLVSAGQKQVYGGRSGKGGYECRVEAALRIIDVAHALLLVLDAEGLSIVKICDFFKQPVQIFLIVQLEDHITQ